MVGTRRRQSCRVCFADQGSGCVGRVLMACQATNAPGDSPSALVSHAVAPGAGRGGGCRQTAGRGETGDDAEGGEACEDRQASAREAQHVRLSLGRHDSRVFLPTPCPRPAHALPYVHHPCRPKHSCAHASIRAHMHSLAHTQTPRHTHANPDTHADTQTHTDADRRRHTHARVLTWISLPGKTTKSGPWRRRRWRSRCWPPWRQSTPKWKPR